MQASNQLSSDTWQNRLGLSLDDPKKKQNPFQRAYRWLNEAWEHPAAQVAPPFVALIQNIGSFAEKFFNLAKGAVSSASPVLKEAQKIAFVGLLYVPFALYTFCDLTFDFAKRSMGKIDKENTLIATAKVGLLAVASFGGVIDIPTKVALMLNSLQSWGISSWVAPLAVFSGFLSAAMLIHSCVEFAETRKLVADLKKASHQAFIARLGEMLKDPKNVALRQALGEIDASKSIAHSIDKALAGIARNKGDVKHLEKLIESFYKRVALDSQFVNTVGELQKAADLAYLDCIKNQPNELLENKFKIKGAPLKVALDKINHHTASSEINSIRSRLQVSLKGTVKSNLLMIVMESVRIIAAAILTATLFVTAASPAAPVAYALLIGAALISIIEVYMINKRKNEVKTMIFNS